MTKFHNQNLIPTKIVITYFRRKCKKLLIDHAHVGYGVVGKSTQQTHHTSKFA